MVSFSCNDAEDTQRTPAAACHLAVRACLLLVLGTSISTGVRTVRTPYSRQLLPKCALEGAAADRDRCRRASEPCIAHVTTKCTVSAEALS